MFEPYQLAAVYGFMLDEELRLLNRLASEVPAGGVIVEIGSFQGKSTIALGLGAKVNGAQVWAIDPHNDYMVDEDTHYGMENHANLLKNLVTYGVADTVRVVALPSAELCWKPEKDIDLIFIDGDHEAKAVKEDFQLWAWHVPSIGHIAFHDYANPLWPGVKQVVSEAVATGEWEIAEEVGSIALLRRVSK